MERFSLTCFCYIVLVVRLIKSNDLEFKIQEEVRLDTVVGDLHKTSLNSQKGQLTILNANDKFVKCFKINSREQLVVARRIDRDQMCEKSALQPIQKSHISIDEECKIILNIGFPEANMMIRVAIIIEDINDNAPSWNQLRIEVKFIDGCKERTKVALPPAHDKDIGQNAQIEYVFKDKDLPFRIDTEDGFYLQTLQSLDREQKESYTFTLVAIDKGHPAQSGEIEVFVTIEDLNDNNPIFSKQIYRFKSISEDSPIGTMVGKLEATDADSGINGKFNFKIAETVPDVVKHYFLIQSDGTVTVAAPLDADRGDNELKFKVIVEDEALRPYSRSSDATVIVYINDINDERPELKLVFMNLDSKTNKPFVVEHTRIGTLIGILDVKDLDYSSKDVVSCTVDKSQFSLISEDRPIKYKIVTNVDFDREKMTSADLRIICRDSAGNVASSNHTINIKDINDNPPSFTKSFHVIKILENMPINTQLPEKLIATDPDSDSTIQYFILPEYAANFSIDRESGIISTRVSFDREACATYQIKVIAKDATRDVINTGTCTVQIQILDENDNKPIFTLDFYTFHIVENSPINTIIGTIEATDLDSPDPRNSLTYRLDHYSVFRQFKINQRSGVITVMTSLDREKMTHYIFPVSVEDGYEYSTPRYTATSTVTIIVDDVNDNAPKFIIPNATKSSFDVSIKETVGHKIIYIQAIDDDYSDNAKIHYNITAGNELGVFSIDPNNGLLFLSDSLQSSHLKAQLQYILTVTACDYGKPKQLCTSFKNLRIIVHNGDEFGNKNPETNREPENKGQMVLHHEAIIICLAIVFITLLISASALICLIKCKPGFWCRRSTRANSEDKRFETGAISQMLPTIDANIKDKEIEETMRNFCSENHQWMMQSDPKGKMGKFGYAVDHTNRPDYQTLESLCLATSMRNTPQPRFVDPCSRFQTQTPFSHSTSFLPNHDLKIVNHLGFNCQNESLINDGQTHVYQSVDENNPVHFYSKLNETKKSSKYNLNESNIDHNSSNNNNNNNNNSNINSNINNNNNCNTYNSNNQNKSAVNTSHSKDKDLSKYATYSFNESSFV